MSRSESDSSGRREATVEADGALDEQLRRFSVHWTRPENWTFDAESIVLEDHVRQAVADLDEYRCLMNKVLDKKEANVHKNALAGQNAINVVASDTLQLALTRHINLMDSVNKIETIQCRNALYLIVCFIVRIVKNEHPTIETNIAIPTLEENAQWWFRQIKEDANGILRLSDTNDKIQTKKFHQFCCILHDQP